MMIKKKLRSVIAYLFAVIFFNQEVFAEKEFLEQEDCRSEKIGITECVVRSPEVTVKNIVCSDEKSEREKTQKLDFEIIPEVKQGVVTFEFCNAEKELVTVLSIDPSGLTFAEHLEPRLPFDIKPEQCMAVTVQGHEKGGFDCSGEYGFGYHFISESKQLDGIGGFVPLLNIKEPETDIEQETERVK